MSVYLIRLKGRYSTHFAALFDNSCTARRFPAFAVSYRKTVFRGRVLATSASIAWLAQLGDRAAVSANQKLARVIVPLDQDSR